MFTSLAGILMLLVPVIVGYLTKYSVNALKVISTFADSSPFVKQIAGLVIASLLAMISAFFHLSLVGNSIGTLTSTDVGAIITALIGWALAMLFHNGAKIATVASPPTSTGK